MLENILFGVAIFTMITGAVLNSLQNRLCFLAWIVSNIIFLYRSVLMQDSIYTIVFSIMLITSIFGVLVWTNKKPLQGTCKDGNKKPLLYSR